MARNNPLDSVAHVVRDGVEGLFFPGPFDEWRKMLFAGIYAKLCLFDCLEHRTSDRLSIHDLSLISPRHEKVFEIALLAKPMMITKLFGILNREMARRRGGNAKGHANRERSRKHGSTSSRKGEIPIQETSCHWQTPRRTQPESRRFDVES